MSLEAFEAKFLSVLPSLGSGDCAHDLDHILRVVSTAKSLMRDERADPWVVVPASYLHDCVQVPKTSPDRSKASRLCAERSIEILTELKFPQAYFEAIFHAVEAHSFSAGVMPLTIEAKVVQDADRLDALGAIGLSRCLMLGGQMAKPLYDHQDPFAKTRLPDDKALVLDHLYAKLYKLPEMMQTASGRVEAAKRVNFMKQFEANLAREIEGA